MRDPARIDRIVELLRVRWKEAPDQRLGQLLDNLATASVYYFEDEVLEKRLRQGADWRDED